jgi:predicted MPP superfamily phosphohydrolase
MPLVELKAAHGVFFVTGNHEYYSGVRSWTKRIADLGIEVLRNRSVFIGDATAGFYLAGTNDYRGGGWGADQGEDLDAALRNTGHRNPVVLLAHNPLTFRRASERNIDLQLSGHTHGGQIWPFGSLIRLRTRFVAGIYRHNRAQLYVSRGTGFWGPPMRVFAPSESTAPYLAWRGNRLPSTHRNQPWW